MTTSPKQNQNNMEIEGQPENDANSVENDICVISTEALTKREKDKAKVRITAYQARILMDGCTVILDHIDNAIMAAINSNMDKTTFELIDQYKNEPYKSQIKNNLISRGFNVTTESTDPRYVLKISWKE